MTRGEMIHAARTFLTRWSARKKQFTAIVVAAVVLDQISKYWAVGALTRAYYAGNGRVMDLGEKLSRFLWTEHPQRSRAIAVIDDFWHFRYAENPGAAWSFLADAPEWFRQPFFLLVSLTAMVFIVVYFRRTTETQRILRVALALVFGGAVGNFLDRARLGYVIDFIDWHWYDKATWPTFNIADACISVGVGLMVLDMILTPKPSTAGATAKSAAGK
jgi:signal peptidase II